MVNIRILYLKVWNVFFSRVPWGWWCRCLTQATQYCHTWRILPQNRTRKLISLLSNYSWWGHGICVIVRPLVHKKALAKVWLKSCRPTLIRAVHQSLWTETLHCFWRHLVDVLTVISNLLIAAAVFSVISFMAIWHYGGKYSYASFANIGLSILKAARPKGLHHSKVREPWTSCAG